MDFKDYVCMGAWLEHLIEVGSPAVLRDDPVTRTLGYEVGGVVHRVKLSVAKMVQETFQTEAQRDRVLGKLQLEMRELRNLLVTPDGRADIIERAARCHSL